MSTVNFVRDQQLILIRYIDSWDALTECFDELEAEKILPKSK